MQKKSCKHQDYKKDETSKHKISKNKTKKHKHLAIFKNLLVLQHNIRNVMQMSDTRMRYNNMIEMRWECDGKCSCTHLY